MVPAWSIYTAPLQDINADLLRSLLDELRRTRLFLESDTLELKRERNRHNVTTAIAAMANAVGGVILLGVDESEPDFDAAPGVDPSEVVAVIQSCHNTLSPRITPEVTTVALPGKQAVVIVIRIEADPQFWPVVKQGQVFIRTYGQSLQATHDQIVQLVERRSTAAHLGGSLSNVAGLFAPLMLTEPELSSAADLVVRVASAIYTRPLVSAPLTFGRPIREELDAAIRESSLSTLGLQDLPQGASLARQPLLFSTGEWYSNRYKVSWRRQGLPRPQLMSLDVRCNGNQVAFAVDVHIAIPEPNTEPEPRIDRLDLTLVLLVALESVAFELTQILIELVGSAPLRVDDLVCWVQSPRGPGLSASLDLSRTHRPVPHERTIWNFQLGRPDQIDGIPERLQEHLRLFYLDLGMDDDEALAAGDVSDARRARSRLTDR